MENKVLIAICFILIGYLFYNQGQIKELMADVSPDIKDAIKQIYNVDVEAIRNLSNVATQLQAGGLTVPGDLRITGNVWLGDKNKNQWIIHTPADDRGLFAINRVFRPDIKDDVNWTNGFQLYTSADGTQNLGGSYNVIPRGTILAFNSNQAPPGWALCDGANGTPDLRGRFIRMQSDSLGGFNEWGGKMVGGNQVSYDKTISGNSRGDVNSWILNHKFGDKAGTDHQTLIPNEIPPHRHYTADANAGRSWGWRDPYLGNGNNGFSAGGGANFGTGNTDQAFLTGDGNAGQSGLAGWGHNNQPPYYVLSYIMKL